MTMHFFLALITILVAHANAETLFDIFTPSSADVPSNSTTNDGSSTSSTAISSTGAVVFFLLLGILLYYCCRQKPTGVRFSHLQEETDSPRQENRGWRNKRFFRRNWRQRNNHNNAPQGSNNQPTSGTASNITQVVTVVNFPPGTDIPNCAPAGGFVPTMQPGVNTGPHPNVHQNVFMNPSAPNMPPPAYEETVRQPPYNNRGGRGRGRQSRGNWNKNSLRSERY